MSRGRPWSLAELTALRELLRRPRTSRYGALRTFAADHGRTPRAVYSRITDLRRRPEKSVPARPHDYSLPGVMIDTGVPFAARMAHILGGSR